MNRKNVRFKNREGIELTGIIDFPIDQDPHNFVLFAHCFTCSKNLNAVAHISRALTRMGYGVLRFDFTGLGQSQGDFADTNFTGNVEDLVDAAHFLRDNYQAPSLMIGHSLGGAATIFAANQLPFVKAVATIGAPSDPIHVRKMLKSKEDEIVEKGCAVVTLAGRDFRIKKQFWDDLKDKPLTEVVHRFGKALLVMHSPQDDTVGVNNAEAIFVAARHPKSFVSLDGMNHLLTREGDADYVGNLIANWATRYLDWPKNDELESESQAVVSLNESDGFTARVRTGNHHLLADEPEGVGKDYGPNPYDYLSVSLAACTAMTVQMYARRKKWPLANITVHITHNKEYVKDSADADQDPKAKIDTFRKKISLTGDLSEEQKNRMMEIADRCPVHRTLQSPVNIISERVD